MLNIFLVSADQVGLEFDELGLHQRNQVLFDVRGVFTFNVEDVLVVVLIMEEFVQGDGRGERAIFLLLLGTFHRKSKLHVVDTQSLAFSLGNITVTVHRGDLGDNKLPCIVLVRGVDDLFTKIFLCPRKTVSVDPVPEVSIVQNKQKAYLDIPVVWVVDHHL